MKNSFFKIILSILIFISVVGCNSNRNSSHNELPILESQNIKTNTSSYQKESNPDLDAIKSQDNILQFMYYTANTKTSEGKSRWYISQISGFYQGMVLSLGPIETINGKVKAGWKEVGKDVATVDIVNEKISIGGIADNPSFDYKDWGLGVDRHDPKIQEDIELIRNSTVNVKWWFFKASNNSWYIINSTGSSIYKFGMASGKYNWQKIDTTGETLEFFIDGNTTKKFRVVPANIAPIADAGEDRDAFLNQAITITGTGTDSDGTIVSYQWKKGDEILANTASFDYTPTVGDRVDTLTLTVTDDDNATHSDTVNIRVFVDNLDRDGDYIPNAIEVLIGTDSNSSDENDNGILDGLESTGNFGDQFFDKQWHLRSLGTQVNDSGISTIVGNDLDLLDIYGKYMGYRSGNPIIVQIVDDGVDADHEDLVDNMDLSRSYNHSSSGDVVGDPSPANLHDTHGTMVAGIMAARAFNGKGVRGIAPFAKIAGSNWLGYQSGSGLDKVWLSGDGANEIAVSNNSWGVYITNDTFFESILAQGTSNLRDGKGRVYVIAAGNDRGDYGNSNISYISNNRYAVAVAALKHDNTHASYSSPGGNVIISGYSGDYYQNSPTIATTTVEGQSVNSGDINEKTTWSEDTNQNYTFAMNGTSAASPTVSGSIALVLEACPNLTWRDIKYLLATQGKRVDSDNSSWVQNSAGLWYSNDYGYGLVNPKGMIESCKNNYTTLGTEKTAEVSGTPNYSLDDGYTVTIGGFDISEDINIEWVELTMDSNHTQASDYGIELISPAGTTIRVVNWTRASGDWMDGGFRFGSAGFIDEHSNGEWKVRVTDYNINSENLSGTIKSLKIKVYGH